jgi:hypothetical protein
MNSKQVYRPVVKFRNIEESVLRAVQSEQDDAKDRDLSDVDSDSEDEGGDANGDEMALPPRAITFEIDPDIDITSQALQDMVLTEHSVRQSASPPQPASANAHGIYEAHEASSLRSNWNWSALEVFWPITVDFH